MTTILRERSVHYVQQHKVQPKMPWLDSQYPCRSDELVHHPARGHIDIRVNPQMCEQHIDEPGRVSRFGDWLVDSEYTECVASCFPGGIHRYYSAVGFLVH